jgi:hypothetical protein
MGLQAPAGGQKAIFTEGMSENEVENAVKAAYRNGRKGTSGLERSNWKVLAVDRLLECGLVTSPAS